MKKIISITIEELIHKQLKEAAERDGRTLSNLIEFIARQYLADK